MSQSKNDDKTFLGSLSDSLGSVFRLGKSRFSETGSAKTQEKLVPEGKYYPPQELGLTYPDLVGKIHSKLLLSQR